jgi:molecular chaperone GrpE (heat shock protein)
MILLDPLNELSKYTKIFLPGVSQVPDSANKLIADEITKMSKNQFKTLQKVEVLSEDILEVLDDLKQNQDRLETSLSEKDEVICFLRTKIQTLSNELQQQSSKNMSAILKVLNICDIMEYVAHFIVEFGDNAWAEQIKSVMSSIGEVLSDIGILEFDALGCTFDEEIHIAVETRSVDQKGDREILEIRKKGYTYMGKLLRKAEVIVNRLVDKDINDNFVDSNLYQRHKNEEEDENEREDEKKQNNWN